jgi:hypothetical protein
MLRLDEHDHAEFKMIESGRNAGVPRWERKVCLSTEARLLLTLIAAAASFLSARRASKLDPMIALRDERALGAWLSSPLSRRIRRLSGWPRPH